MEIDSRERREGARQIPRERNPAGAQGLGKPCVNVVPVAASVKTKVGRSGVGVECANLLGFMKALPQFSEGLGQRRRREG